MKSKTILLSLIAGFTIGTACAQPGGPRGAMGGPPSGPKFGGYMAKIFADNPNFSANLEVQTSGDPSGDMTMPGTVAISDGKMRFEMDVSSVKGGKASSPQSLAAMKRMGMDKMVIIGRPDKKVTYMVMSGLKAYIENPMQDLEASKTPSDYKTEETKLGEDTVSGLSCIKYKEINTGSDGVAHESTVWKAKDLKGFPVKIETVEDGKNTVWLLKDVKVGKPEASQFEPPADFKKYNSFMELIMGQMQNAQPH